MLSGSFGGGGSDDLLGFAFPFVILSPFDDCVSTLLRIAEFSI